MKLSLLMPSPNVGSRVHMNLLNFCSLGAEEVEVRVRDTSQDAQKHDFLAAIHEHNCYLSEGGESSPWQSLESLLSEAQGEFVFPVSDQGWVNESGIPTLCEELDRIWRVHTMIGATALYAIEHETETALCLFDTLDETALAQERVQNLLTSGHPNVVHHSAIRREVLQQVAGFCAKLPLCLPTHNWLCDALLLIHGRMSCLPYYVYQCSAPDGGARNPRPDTRAFEQAGVDPSAQRLQWLVLAFEGMQTIANKYPCNLPAAQRNELAAGWFGHWMDRFVKAPMVELPGAKFDVAARQLAKKWHNRRFPNPSRLLADLAEYYALCSPELGRRYYEFWQ